MVCLGKFPSIPRSKCMNIWEEAPTTDIPKPKVIIQLFRSIMALVMMSFLPLEIGTHRPHFLPAYPSSYSWNKSSWPSLCHWSSTSLPWGTQPANHQLCTGDLQICVITWMVLNPRITSSTMFGSFQITLAPFNLIYLTSKIIFSPPNKLFLPPYPFLRMTHSSICSSNIFWIPIKHRIWIECCGYKGNNSVPTFVLRMDRSEQAAVTSHWIDTKLRQERVMW